MDNNYDLNWIDVPMYEGTYKVAEFKGKLLLYNVKKNKGLKYSESYSLSQFGKQVVVSQSKLRELCNL